VCDNKGHRLVRFALLLYNCSSIAIYIVCELYIVCIYAERPRSKVSARASGKSVICKLSRVAKLWPRKLKSPTSSCVSQSVVSSAFCCTSARAHPPPVADAARARSATPPRAAVLRPFPRTSPPTVSTTDIRLFKLTNTHYTLSCIRVKRHHDDSIVRTVYIYIYISEHTPTHRHRRRLPTN